ncbi:grifin [Lissotriton helveticus]
MALRCEVHCPDGICPGWSLIVKGETTSSENSFEINFLSDAIEQIAFHFNPRFSESRIVCNSFLSSRWGQEERADAFPLEAKEPFQIEIYPDQEHFQVFIDDIKILQYRHRLKHLSLITKVQIINDINISSVELTKRELY